MTDGLHTRIEDRVMILTLDRPKANAINGALSKALGEAFIGYRDDRHCAAPSSPRPARSSFPPAGI